MWNKHEVSVLHGPQLKLQEQRRFKQTVDDNPLFLLVFLHPQSNQNVISTLRNRLLLIGIKAIHNISKTHF